MEAARKLGWETEDYGSTDPIYANTAIVVAEAVAAKKAERGVLLCGTGLGMSIAARRGGPIYRRNLTRYATGDRCGNCYDRSQ